MHRYVLTILFISASWMARAQQLTVRPLFPSFLRPGDHVELAAQVFNASATELTGQVQLELTDLYSGQSVDGWFMNTFPNQYFTVAAGQRDTVRFPVQVPASFSGLLQWKITAGTGTNAPGQHDVHTGPLPVRSDADLHTEGLTLTVKHAGTMPFELQPLVKNGNRETVQHRTLTAEYITDLRWYIADAMPILMRSTPDDAQSSFIAYSARALALSLLNNHSDRNALDSALLLRTSFPNDDPVRPRPLQPIEQQFAYDLPRLESELTPLLGHIASLQLPNGGFPWLRGGPADNNTTIALLARMGQLESLKIVPTANREGFERIKRQALRYIDSEFLSRPLKDSGNVIPYLYVRSFFGASEMTMDTRISIDSAIRSETLHWKELPRGQQAMLSIALWRAGNRKLAATILPAAIQAKEATVNDGIWWQQPVEIRALLLSAAIETGSPLAKTQLDALIALRKGYDWVTAAASFSASAAILLDANKPRPAGPIALRIGTIAWTAPATPDGHRLVAAPSHNIDSISGRGELQTNDTAAYFHLTWQYTDEAERSPSAPLRIEKTLFHQAIGRARPKAVSEGEELRIGDTVTIQLRITTGRNLDHVRVDDGWASMFESTEGRGGRRIGTAQAYFRLMDEDAAHFYFARLARGSYVLSYRVRVSWPGEGSSGRATVQCDEAPSIRAWSAASSVSVLP